MSERKVLQKYFPPDFDPSALSKRQKGPKQVGPKVIPIRLMAPFSMRCTSCGEFIYKGRKFNARKETAEEKYLSIAVFRFHIKCTRCSGEIVFKTDPRNMDYVCERGAKRNFEPWREKKDDISDEQHLDNLEAMEAEEAEREQGDAMADLEERAKVTKNEMAIADALDNIRSRNARIEANEKAGKEVNVQDVVDWEKQRQEEEDEEAARMAFQTASGERIRRITDEDEASRDSGVLPTGDGDSSFVFKKPAKPKKDFTAVLGVKTNSASKVMHPPAKSHVTPPLVKKAAPPKKPVLLAGYDSDSD